MKHRGFSLIELLVVIAIIAIIAALLLPTLGNTKAQATRAYCQNNLRQLGIALTMYGESFDRYPPVSAMGMSPPAEYLLWNAFLLPYVDKNIQVFDCPSYPIVFEWTTLPASNGYLFP